MQSNAVTKRRWKKGVRGWVAALPFILPGLILVGLFVLYPMLFTIRISLSNYKIVQGQIDFVGLKNYISILTDASGRFWYAYRNNFLYALVTVPLILFGGMVFAYLINNLKRGRTIFKVGFYLPVITSWVIVSLVFTYMFNNSDRGLINYILVDKLHILKDYVPWLLREWSGNAAIWLMGAWKNIGWAMLIFLAALQSIPRDLYEAADLDGAGHLGQIQAYHDRLPEANGLFCASEHDYRVLQRVYPGADAHGRQAQRQNLRFAVSALR